MAGSVTTESKTICTPVTRDRWAAPLLIIVLCTRGGGIDWTSKAPMSALLPTTRAKPDPRWSLTDPAAFEPALMHGLPGKSAIVCVGPPLFASDPSLRLATGWKGKLFEPV